MEKKGQHCVFCVFCHNKLQINISIHPFLSVCVLLPLFFCIPSFSFLFSSLFLNSLPLSFASTPSLFLSLLTSTSHVLPFSSLDFLPCTNFFQNMEGPLMRFQPKTFFSSQKSTSSFPFLSPTKTPREKKNKKTKRKQKIKTTKVKKEKSVKKKKKKHKKNKKERKK